MSIEIFRTRFAPAPTGLMHIGNIRIALLNYIFAKKNFGDFILRIEDTDSARNFDIDAIKIIDSLNWLNLKYTEGPQINGKFAPYFQSKRASIYSQALSFLISKKAVYKCFCSTELLEKKRNRQLALKQPPRYDKFCLKLSESELLEYETQKREFIYRFNIDLSANERISFIDLARGKLEFELKNFSDFPCTRADGSATFIFANAVDDATMEITHVFRGEDHLTNTVCQVLIFKALEKTVPIFWHCSILCNLEGKKLSKRDNGFSLEDLKAAGFLPEAIINYLALIGVSFKEEILSLDEIVSKYNFENLKTVSHIKYDFNKLKWINHKWILKKTSDELAVYFAPFLKEKFQITVLDLAKLANFITLLKNELYCLDDLFNYLFFYFKTPFVELEFLNKNFEIYDILKLKKVCSDSILNSNNFEVFLDRLKNEIKINNLDVKIVYSFIRYLITGNLNGLAIKDLVCILGYSDFKVRLLKFI